MSVHLKIINLHSFCIFGYKVGWMISQLFPPWPPQEKHWGKKQKKHEGGGYGNTNSLLERTATELNLHPTPSTGSS